MSAEGKETAVADLRLSVYLRAIHPEFFAIRARQAFRQPEFEAEIWLLGPGHVITFLSGSSAITEVIAPRDLELPRRGLVRSADLVGEHEERFEARGPVVYQMAFQVDAAAPETYRLEAEELLAGAQKGHLSSAPVQELARQAFSYAVPDPKARSLMVHTWHGFPAESTILRTQTLIERVEA